MGLTVLVVRGTADFRKRVRGPALAAHEEPTGRVGEWFANVRLWRPHLAIFVHRRTYLPVLVPLAPASSVIERFGEHLETMLQHLGVPATAIARERGHRAEHRIAPTDDRRVVGVMTEYLRILDWWRQDVGGIDQHNMLDLSLKLASTPVRASKPRASWPDRDVLELMSE